ncbi:hypothetical protein HX014_15695 [Myroides marinus]|uniref:ADP-ribosyltransferase n=1 Tax=Myroides marinus TaxID=703342 RepID=UPI002574C4BB|nr:ADP-ribosyltransferase [Myroides marinus]MDM1352073.1 hypothetical protein [Myroides marinus]MDM1359241.1 hypothetical protein [Myroides marinus]
MLTKLFALFEQEEKKRYREEKKSSKMIFVTRKKDNKYRESYNSFLKVFGSYTYKKTAGTAENLDAITDYNIPLKLAAIIYMYTAYEHFDVTNNQLRKRDTEKVDKDIKEYSNLLNKALNYLPHYKNQTVYRDIHNFSDEIIKYYKQYIGEVITEKSFLSTHIENSRWSDEDTGVHFIIKTADKTNARDLRTLSFNSQEQEVLIKSGTKFKIISVDEEKNIINMEEIEKSNEVGDGIINEASFKAQKLKILFVLRETYEDGENEEDKGGWHITDAINNWIEGKTHRIPTYKNITKTISHITNKTNTRDLINNIAIINIKKIPGSTKSNKDILAKHFMINKERLDQEIETINPDIIIFGGTAHHFEQHWNIKRDTFPKEPKECNYIIKIINGKEIVCPIALHPSAPGYQKCIKEIKELLVRKGII